MVRRGCRALNPGNADLFDSEIRQAPENQIDSHARRDNNNAQNPGERGYFDHRAVKYRGDDFWHLFFFLGPFPGADHGSTETDQPLETGSRKEKSDDSRDDQREAEEFRGIAVPVFVGYEREKESEKRLYLRKNKIHIKPSLPFKPVELNPLFYLCPEILEILRMIGP